MGILGNYKINELSDEEIEEDLKSSNLHIETKTLEILELTRRRIKETKDSILWQVPRFSDS